MKISVVGTGYVGLVTGTCLAETGNDVLCIDVDEAKVERMKNGEVPIYEPHLDVYFERNLKAGRLHFSTDLARAVAETDIIFLALPTPPDEDGSADLSYVLGVAKQIGQMMTGYKIIIDKSTVPVGTADKVKSVIAEETDVQFDVVSNPEFLREGFAVDDFMKPDRIVIGTSSSKARESMEHLYKPFIRSGNPIIFMDERSAELTKYAANAFLATKITFMNEVANFCERVGADVDKVRLGMGSDDRIGKRFLFPGIGYGGSCFPKDVQALAKSGRESGFDFQILDAVMRVNEGQKTILVPDVLRHFNGEVNGVSIAIWGLAFKPDTDDIREAPALYIIDELVKRGAKITAFDPEAMENVRMRVGDAISYAEDMYSAAQGADALIICTEWGAFRNPNMDRLAESLNSKVIFDGRNLYDLADMRKRGFHYRSIGRKIVQAD
jgi:UDPglucose 6-dehydrogenase